MQLTEQPTVPDFSAVAKALLEFLRSDFANSGDDVCIEAICAELENAYRVGLADA